MSNATRNERRNAMCNNVSRSRVTHAQPSPTSPAQPSPPVVTSMETSHHVVASVTRETPDEMMHCALETIEHLDFEAEITCETLRCERRGPLVADFVVEFIAPDFVEDLYEGRWLCCSDCWTFGCNLAGEQNIALPWRIVGLVR